MACAVLISGLAANPLAIAGPLDEPEGIARYDYSKVVRVEPIVRQVRVSECPTRLIGAFTTPDLGRPRSAPYHQAQALRDR